MTILADTDANATPAAPASPPFGTSLHDELGLLVDAGLTPVEALNAATSLAARQFGLDDRGRIAPGLRADLVLPRSRPDRRHRQHPLHQWRVVRGVSPGLRGLFGRRFRLMAPNAILPPKAMKPTIEAAVT